MPISRKAAGASGDLSNRVQLPGSARSEDSPKLHHVQYRPSSVATAIMAAITGALDRADAAERPHLLAWIAGRGLLGLAHQVGFGEAAGVAYQLADVLAGGVQ